MMNKSPSTIFLQQFLADPKNNELFGEFVARYRPRIKSCFLAQKLQDADADDLTEEILIRFLERDMFDNFIFQKKEQFYRWLRVIVVHAVLNFLRNRGRRPDSWSVGNSEAQESLGRKSEIMAHNLESVWEADLQRVSEACTDMQKRLEANTWQAFHLQVYEGLRPEAVAQQLKMSLSSVYTARSRTLQKLREELRERDTLEMFNYESRP